MKTFSDLYEKTLNVAQRRKQGIRMKALARSSAFQMKKKREFGITLFMYRIINQFVISPNIKQNNPRIVANICFS